MNTTLSIPSSTRTRFAHHHATSTLFMAVMLGSLVFPGVVRASLLTLDQAQLLQLWDVFENPPSSEMTLTSQVPSGGGVVFSGVLFDAPGNVASPFAQIGIGAESCRLFQHWQRPFASWRPGYVRPQFLRRLRTGPHQR